MVCMGGVLCKVSNATSTPLENGSAVVTTRGIPYADNPTDIKDDGRRYQRTLAWSYISMEQPFQG